MEVSSQFRLRDIDKVQLELGIRFDPSHQKEHPSPGGFQSLKIWAVQERAHLHASRPIDYRDALRLEFVAGDHKVRLGYAAVELAQFVRGADRAVIRGPRPLVVLKTLI